MMEQKLKYFAWSFFLLGCFVFPSLGLSQMTPQQKQEKSAFQQTQQTPEKSKEELLFQEVQLKLMEQAFEKAVDPKTYIVGPGDVFSIVIWGDIQKGFQLPVTAEGRLIIPTLGSLQVADKTLEDVKKIVMQAGVKKYKKAKVSAYLMGVRKIRVHVVGQVTLPGTYVATPLDRVSDVIARAGNIAPFALLSGIEIIHASGGRDTVDYNKFQKYGDIESNPCLRGGDIVFIPAINKNTPTVTVVGTTNNPGLFPIDARETLAHFFSRNNKVVNLLNFQEIFIIRSNGKKRIIQFPSPEFNMYRLKNGDMIKIAKIRNVVYVKGAVRNPGEYPYSPNFTASDYTGMAGAMEKSADLNSIRVYHRATKKIEKGENVIPQPGDVVELPVTLRERIISYFQIASQIASVIIAIAAVRNTQVK